MPELTHEEKIKIFEKLPKELQDLMGSEDTGAFLLYLEEKYNLDDDKISLLSRLVGDVILGILSSPNLISEIVSKLAVDQNTGSQIYQEINSGLLAPVAALIKNASAPATSMPAPALPVAPRADKYREPATSAPEVIDLRKTPPPLISMPVTPAPIPPIPKIVTPPASKPAPKPLTFTKPIEPVRLTAPLLEAEPHLPPATPTPSAFAPVPSADQYREPMSPAAKPQYIIRPPGLQPTDLPKNVLDLRKDKGEF